jgi:hypothetical protein
MSSDEAPLPDAGALVGRLKIFQESGALMVDESKDVARRARGGKDVTELNPVPGDHKVNDILARARAMEKSAHPFLEGVMVGPSPEEVRERVCSSAAEMAAEAMAAPLVDLTRREHMRKRSFVHVGLPRVQGPNTVGLSPASVFFSVLVFSTHYLLFAVIGNHRAPPAWGRRRRLEVGLLLFTHLKKGQKLRVGEDLWVGPCACTHVQVYHRRLEARWVLGCFWTAGPWALE